MCVKSGNILYRNVCTFIFFFFNNFFLPHGKPTTAAVSRGIPKTSAVFLFGNFSREEDKKFAQSVCVERKKSGRGGFHTDGTTWHFDWIVFAVSALETKNYGKYFKYNITVFCFVFHIRFTNEISTNENVTDTRVLDKVQLPKLKNVNFYFIYIYNNVHFDELFYSFFLLLKNITR